MTKHVQFWRFRGWAGLLILAAFVPAFLAGAETSAPPAAATRPIAGTPRRPSIILILADDLGYGELGCYGQTRIKTPNIDRLAAEGTRFSNFYAGSTVCAPSRCALMTGLHTGHAVIRGNANIPLGPGDETVAELLQGAGYRTTLIGKWGLGEAGSTGVPQKKGFYEFVGYLNQTHAHDYYTDYLWHYEPVGPHDDKQPLPENREDKKGLYTHDLFTSGALNFLRINKPDQFNKYRPFFLFLAYTIPHANNEEGRRTGNGMQVPSDAPYSSEAWPQPEKNKAAMITRLDRDVGRILDKLAELKIDDNTIVLFTSDNGPHKEGGVDPKFFQSSGPLRGIKRDLYEGGIRVPMIARWPNRIPRGRVSDQVWAFWDLLPTMAEIAQVKPPEKIDGISMLPTLLGQAQTNQHEFLYWEFHERGFQQAARMGEWKALRPQANQTLELYHLRTDPAEKNNVAGDNPKIVAKFEDYFKTARTAADQWPIKAAPATNSPAPATTNK